jgi:hypothetical protein
MHNSSVVFMENVLYQALKKLTNICRFSWKRVNFELQVLHSLLIFFFQKSCLGTQVSISSEIHQEFRKIQHLPKKGHAHRFYRILNTP